MLSHVTLGSNDLVRSRRFYDAVMGVLGARPALSLNFNSERILYQHAGSLLVLATPLNGEAASAANGGTIGLLMASPAQVDAFHAAALANGGASCEEPPGVRETPAGSLYLAYLRDPDGNKLCAFHTLADSAPTLDTAVASS